MIELNKFPCSCGEDLCLSTVDVEAATFGRDSQVFPFFCLVDLNMAVWGVGGGAGVNQ